MTLFRKPPRGSLTEAHAVMAWLLRWDGWTQHQIGALFGVNQGSISRILSERSFGGSRQIAERIIRET